MRLAAFLLFSIFLATAKVNAQQPFIKDYWLNETGAAQKVTALVQDVRGYIWVSSDEGLYRFNGRSFTLISDAGQQITALALGGTDSIFIGHADGSIALFAADSIRPYNYAGPHPASAINTLLIAGGALLAGTTSNGIFALANGRSYQLSSRGGLSDDFVYSLALTGDSRLLAATDQGINILSCNAASGIQNVLLQARNSGLPDNIIRVLKSAPGAPGVFWTGTQDGGIAMISLHGSAAAVLPACRNWKYGQVNDLFPLSDTTAWACTEDGYLVYCQWKNGQCSLRPYAYPGKKFRKLLQDASGNIWAGTAEGLTMVTDNFLSFLSVTKDFGLSLLTAFTCDREGALWYALGRKLYRLMPADSALPALVLTAPAPITTMYSDSGARLWLGTLGGGVLCHEHGSLQPVCNLPGITGSHILHISGQGDRLWVSSLNGVEELLVDSGNAGAPRVLRHHGKHTGIGSDYVYQLYPDRQGRMWMATDGAGVAMWDGAQYHHWDSADGMPAKVIYSITQDASGRIWAATLREGIFVWDGARWSAIGMKEGLQDKNISTLTANASGQLVVVHTKGLDEWYPASNTFRHFNRRLGVDIDSQSTNLNIYAHDPQGAVWIPFEHGFIHFGNLTQPVDIRPGVSIERVLLFDKKMPRGQAAFEAGENYISIRYDGINFTSPDKLYYRYMLEGYSSSWISTLDEGVSFPRLPAGSYRFRVQAALSQQFDGAAEADYAFRITAPLWKRPGTIVLMALLAGLLIYGIVRLRERSLRRLAMLQRERMKAEYEQLKSQVNPHFLFNSLNTLVNLIEESPKAAVDYTVELSDFYRDMLAYRDKDLIPLEEEWNLLQKYFYIQQGRFGDGLYLKSDIEPRILEEKKIIPLALQLLVENAIKHNVIAPTTPLVIYISATEDSITVRHLLQPKFSPEKGTGLGLANIRRRYALLTRLPFEWQRGEHEFIVTLPLL